MKKVALLLLMISGIYNACYAECPLQKIIPGGYFFSLDSTPKLVGDQLGFTLKAVGDVDGDGITDFAADSFRDIDDIHFAPAVRVWSGRTKSLLARFHVPIALSVYGDSIAGVSDLNNDGFNDILVGETFYGYGNTTPGRVFAYSVFPTPKVLFIIEGFKLTSGSYGLDSFGQAIVALPDLNGDGKVEYAISASNYGDSDLEDPTYAGMVFIFDGASKNIINYLSIRNMDVQGFGKTMHLLQDITGDGISDLAVGVDVQIESGTIGGVAFYNGALLGNSSANSLIQLITPNQYFSDFGETLASLGDLTGDGLSEFALSTPAFYQEFPGPVFILSPQKSGNDLNFVPINVISPPEIEYSDFGRAMESVRDYDGDGKRDLAISSPFLKNRRVSIYSSVSGKLILNIPQGFEKKDYRFGISMAVLGDTNGDGFEEIVISEPTSLDPITFPDGKFEIGFGPDAGQLLIYSISQDTNTNGVLDVCELPASNVPGANNPGIFTPPPGAGGNNSDKRSEILNLLKQAQTSAGKARKSPAGKDGKAAKKEYKVIMNNIINILNSNTGIQNLDADLVVSNIKNANKNFNKVFSKNLDIKSRNKAWKTFNSLIKKMLS